MDKLKPETNGDFEKGASLKAIHADDTPADGSVPSDTKVSRPIYCDKLARFSKPMFLLCDSPCRMLRLINFVLQKPQTLGQYMVGDVLTQKEALLSWTGVAIMFFVVLVPTTNQTILAYFTKQVGPACCCALQTKLF